MTVHVFTFKRGLLSRVAHDLRLSVERYEVELDGEVVTARFDARSLFVDGTMKRGRLTPEGLDDKDVGEVLDNTRKHVLLSDQHPWIRFEGRIARGDAHIAVAGTLELVGQRRPIGFTLTLEGDRARGEVELQPSRWGIEPFSILMGTIAVQDRVVVAFDLLAPASP